MGGGVGPATAGQMTSDQAGAGSVRGQLLEPPAGGTRRLHAVQVMSAGQLLRSRCADTVRRAEVTRLQGTQKSNSRPSVKEAGGV